MAINVSQAFHRTSANPIDDSQALTKAEMLTVNDNLMPSKYFTVCQDDGFIYLYDKSNTADPETGKFRKFEGGGGSYTAGDGINIDNNEISTDNLQEGDMEDIVSPLPPTPVTADTLGALSDVDLTDPQDGDALIYDEENEVWVNGPGGGGSAELESAITTNLTVGAVASGTTLPQGMSFTEVMQKLFITEVAPTTTFTASGSGIKEVGTSVTPTLTLVINSVGSGTPVNIKFYDGSTLLDTQAYVDGTTTYTYTMNAVTTTTTVKGVLEYKKSDDTTATLEKSATYTFVMASYYGAVSTAPTDKAGIIALTKNVKNTKAQTATFTLSNQRACYCYPTSMGNLTSIKDANGFDYISGYTKTNVTVDEVSYNVYTQTDPVTASGFKQIYA